MSVIDYAEVIRRYQVGENIADIAKFFSVSEETISNVLKRQNISLRKDNPAPKNEVAKLPGKLPGQAPGELPPVPVKPPHGNNAGIKRYYEENNAQILEELGKLGEKAVRERWAFSKRSWAVFRQDNDLPIKTYRKPSTAAANGTYVSFPPFSEKWPPEVQCKWLEIYSQLAEVSK